MLVSALQPMSAGDPQGYSVTMTSAKLPQMIGGMGRTVALNEAIKTGKTNENNGLVACPKMLDNWLQSPERPVYRTSSSKGLMSTKFASRGGSASPGIASKVRLAPVSKSPLRPVPLN